MTITLILKILHILSAMALITGTVAREITRSQARKSTDLKIFQELSSLVGQFESKLVIPGSLLVFLFGLVLALIQKWPILGFLQGSSQNWLLLSILLLLSMTLTVPTIFLPRGKVFEAALKDAVDQGVITPQLRLTFNDPVVRLAHRWEENSLLVVIILMVAKPF